MKKITLQEILTGNILTREWVKQQRKLLGLIATFVFVYIYFGFLSQRQHRRLTEIQQQIEEASYIQLTINAQLTNTTRPSVVAEELKARGSNIKELTQPVVMIKE